MTIRSVFKPGRTALLPFLTAGIPDADSSADLFVAMATAGADAFEIGIPYSDPLMDGAVIQEASSRALAAGATLESALEIVAAVTDRTQVPCLAMTYANVVFRTGPEQFCSRLAAAGASGLIIPDMPVEEAADVKRAADESGLGLALFVAPTSSDGRIRAVAELDPVFIYGVAELGVTGERSESSARAAWLAERVRQVTDVPLVLGVGISTPDQAAAAGRLADGVIVGTALVRRVLEAPDAVSAASSLTEAVTALRSALD
ncbi:tryptophan synthase subunit alpha [soil metagenome]